VHTLKAVLPFAVGYTFMMGKTVVTRNVTIGEPRDYSRETKNHNKPQQTKNGSCMSNGLWGFFMSMLDQSGRKT